MDIIIELGDQLTRLEQLALEFGRDLVENYDHCEDAHKYSNGACRVCNAERFLEQVREIRHGEGA